MRPLRYSINVTLDGCVDHRAVVPDEELHQRAAATVARADALIFGRVTYELMESGWRHPVPPGTRPVWTAPFADTINAQKKYLVSSTLKPDGWNTELLRGELGPTVQRLKEEPGQGLLVGGVRLPMALAELDLIDEFEFVVHPRVAGHGPRLCDGLRNGLDLRLVDRLEYGSGAVAMRSVPRR